MSRRSFDQVTKWNLEQVLAIFHIMEGPGLCMTSLKQLQIQFRRKINKTQIPGSVGVSDNHCVCVYVCVCDFDIE